MIPRRTPRTHTHQHRLDGLELRLATAEAALHVVCAELDAGARDAALPDADQKRFCEIADALSAAGFEPICPPGD